MTLGFRYVIGLATLALSCQNQSESSSEHTSELQSTQAEELKNGWLTQWDFEARKDWYLTPQGSNLVAYDVFRSLPEIALKEDKSREKTGKLLTDRSVMEKYGFVFPTEEQAGVFTKNGLPFGLIPETPTMSAPEHFIFKNVEYLGYTCAACHTGEAVINKKRYVIDGGQPFLDQGAFFRSLYLSLTTTLQDMKNAPEDLKNGRDGIAANAFKKYYAIKAQKGTQPLPDQRAFLQQFGKELFLSTNRLAKLVFRASTKDAFHKGTQVITGPGRSDAVTNIFNALFGDMLNTGNEFSYPANKVIVPPAHPDTETATTVPYRDNDVNVLKTDVPVSIPVVWNVSELECVQHNCLASSPLIRNIGEAIGVFGYAEINPNKPNIFNFKEKGKKLSDVTTVKVGNVVKLEASLQSIKSPKWPSSLLGKLDPKKVKAGQKLFEQNCNSCHAIPGVKNSTNYTEKNVWGNSFVKVGQIPYDVVGTDPLFIQKHGPRTAVVNSVLEEVPGVLAKLEKKNNNFQNKYPYPKEVYECLTGKNPENGEIEYKPGHFLDLSGCDELKAQNKGSTLDLLSFVTTVIAEGYLDEKYGEDYSAETLKKQANEHGGHTYGKFFAKPFYRARPLNGIAFSAPYLHNGSVTSLWELLNPELRKDQFKVGSINFEYDATKPHVFGFEDAGSTVIDTSIPGNQNIGHTFGSHLSHSEKKSLIEFLKSL